MPATSGVLESCIRDNLWTGVFAGNSSRLAVSVPEFLKSLACEMGQDDLEEELILCGTSLQMLQAASTTTAIAAATGVDHHSQASTSASEFVQHMRPHGSDTRHERDVRRLAASLYRLCVPSQLHGDDSEDGHVDEYVHLGEDDKGIQVDGLEARQRHDGDWARELHGLINQFTEAVSTRMSDARKQRHAEALEIRAQVRADRAMQDSKAEADAAQFRMERQRELQEYEAQAVAFRKRKKEERRIDIDKEIEMLKVSEWSP
jgi:hypothetical protein